VTDHDTGRVVWVSKDRTKDSFEQFFHTLGPHRARSIEAISLDGNSVYLPVAANTSRRPPSAWTRSTSSAGQARSSIRFTAPKHPDSRPVRDGPTAGSGGAPAMRYAPAPSTSTSPTTPSSPACAGTATGSGAPGS
jgi:hypothetical protein